MKTFNSEDLDLLQKDGAVENSNERQVKQLITHMNRWIKTNPGNVEKVFCSQK